MKLLKFTSAIALLAALSFLAPAPALHAQAATPATAQASSADAPTIHQIAMKLLEAMGTRKVLSENIDAMIENGKQKMIQQHPELDPAFSEEWSRRMHERINLDEFLNVIAAIYEKHFTTSELTEMIGMYHELSEQRAPQVSDALKAKLNNVMPEIQAEMGAGLMELSEKIGSEVAISVAKDHPEYVKGPPPSEPPAEPAPQK
jgi:hypothetical protein